MNHCTRFHAEWCMLCKMGAPAWEQFKKNHSKEYIFEDVDVDADNETASKYEVMSVPTILITDEEGNILVKHVGAYSPKDLEDMISLSV